MCLCGNIWCLPLYCFIFFGFYLNFSYKVFLSYYLPSPNSSQILPTSLPTQLHAFLSLLLKKKKKEKTKTKT